MNIIKHCLQVCPEDHLDTGVSHLVAVCHEGQIAAAVVEGLDHQRVVGAVPQGRQILVPELCRNQI